MHKLLSVLFFVLLITACKKEHDKDWLVADITITDSKTGEPIPNCQAYLCYVQYTALGSYYENPEHLGSTDENGYLRVEWMKPRKAENLKIILRPTGKYVGLMGGTSVECSPNGPGISVGTGKLNVINRSFEPWAMYRCHYKNENCFDENDSMRVYFNLSGGPDDPYTLTSVIHGCADSLFPADLSYYPYIPTVHPHMELEKHVYKNGVHSILYQTVELSIDGEIQTIEITY